jgi:hypothetical protein
MAGLHASRTVRVIWWGSHALGSSLARGPKCSPLWTFLDKPLRLRPIDQQANKYTLQVAWWCPSMPRLHTASAGLERTTGVLLMTVLLLTIRSGAAFLPHQGQSQPRAQRPCSGQTQHFADRTPFITGNWKLNPSTRQEAIELASKIAQSVTPSSPADVALFVPYPFLECVQRVVGDRLVVGAEVSRRGQHLLLLPCNTPLRRDQTICPLTNVSLLLLDSVNTTGRGPLSKWSVYGRHISCPVEESRSEVGAGGAFGETDDQQRVG